MKNVTLCYLDRGDAYLMLHRVKKKNDINHDKWIGVGGKFEDKESPEECMLREAFEETGLTLTDYQYRGIVTFVSDEYETEYMHLFTASAWSGEMSECNEGILEWVPKNQVPELPIWEGDKIFFRLIAENRPFFSLKLSYSGDILVDAVLDGKRII
ncbi:MAG: 8-oxo-dGTP diphosphatase [Clostridiaceae bacterium]|nr:8-oxo-dGTP diphosphatase [Clostridiaceae bacterium]